MSQRLKKVTGGITNLLKSDQKSIENQLAAAGVFTIKQQDHALRVYYMSTLNDIIRNPRIEINDKIETGMAMVYEMGAMWAAAGGNPMFARLLDSLESVHDIWVFIYYTLKPDYTYYTAIVEISEMVMAPVTQAEGGSKIITVQETEVIRTREIDSSTLMYYEKEMPESIKVVEIREHKGRISRRDKYEPWTREELDRQLYIFGVTQVLRYIRQAAAYSVLPEHVNPRTNIVVHGTVNPKDTYSGPREREDETGLVEAAQRFKEKHPTNG